MKFSLYSYFRSSASYRVRIALNLKKIAYNYRPVHLVNHGGEQFQSSYAAVNASREVPTLIHHHDEGDRVIGQSVAIIDYLDRIEPREPLFSQEPYTRALMLQACEIVNSGVQPLHNLRVLNKLATQLSATEETKNEWTAYWLKYGLETLETFLKPHSGKFSFGDRPSAVDCFLIPNLANADRFKVSLEPYRTLTSIRTNCDLLPEFVKASPANSPDAPVAP